MKALLVDLETQWRGGQNQALLLLEGLRTRGHEGELVAAQGSALGRRAEASGIRVHYVSRELFRLPAAFSIRKLLRKRSFDLVHANEAHAVTAAWLALRSLPLPARVPFVVSRRVGYSIGKSPLAKARYNGAARIVAISKWSANHIVKSGIPETKISIVHEGVEIPPRVTPGQRQAARARWNVSDEAPLLGCVGVLLPDKGQEWLIRALPDVRKESPPAKLLLAGDGPCRTRLEELSQKLGVADAVIFAGFVSDVQTVYAALDVFLLPSLFEALSNALMTAMANAVPSVAFNCGGPAEIIEDGRSGLLVSGPNVAEISAAIKKLLTDRELALQLGEAGRQHIAQIFSADRMVDGITAVYQECLRREL